MVVHSWIVVVRKIHIIELSFITQIKQIKQLSIKQLSTRTIFQNKNDDKFISDDVPTL